MEVNYRDPKFDWKKVDEYNKKVKDINDKIETKFISDCASVRDQMKPLFARLNTGDIMQIPELQASVLKIRQELQDDISVYLNRLSKENVKYRKCEGDRLEYYITGFSIKSASSEKTKMINRDLAEKKRGIEILETHIEHLRDYKYACDQIMYAVKNLVSIASYIN